MTFRHLIICLVLTTAFADVVVNPLEGISNNNLVFSGSLPVVDGSNSTLFFTYYGINGEKDQEALKNSPLMIFLGK